MLGWLPWQDINDENLPYFIQPYIKFLQPRLPEGALIIQEENKYYIQYESKKVEITPDKMVHPILFYYLSVVNDLPKLKKICAVIDKISDIDAGQKKILLDLAMYCHHLLGLDAGKINVESILACLQSQVVLANINNKMISTTIPVLEEFVSTNIKHIQDLFTGMRVEEKASATPNVAMFKGKTGGGIISQAHAVADFLDEQRIEATCIDVGSFECMRVMHNNLGTDLTDQISIWNQYAVTRDPTLHTAMLKYINADVYVGALLGVPLFLEEARKKLWHDGTTCIITPATDRPSPFISALGPALGVPIALFATDHIISPVISSGVMLAAQTAPQDANIVAMIQDLEDVPETERSKYTIMHCPVNPAIRKLEPAEIDTLKSDSLGAGKDQKVIGITFGGLGHKDLIKEILALPDLPTGHQYVIALSTQATIENKAEILKIAAEKGLQIKFADECFGIPNTKLTQEQMNNFYNCCDLVICKPGGSTTAELPTLGVPAVLLNVATHANMESANLKYLLRTHPESYRFVDCSELSAALHQIPPKFAPTQTNWRELIRSFVHANIRTYKPEA